MRPDDEAGTNETGCLFDKRGIPIERGDIVRVFHFTGARRRRYYMYKQHTGIKLIGPEKSSPYVRFGHLNLRGDDDHDGYYLERPDGRILHSYEIVQSIKNDHEERSRKTPTP
jgi:hypothetical protein